MQRRQFVVGAGAAMLGLADAAAFARFWQAEIERWSKVARAAKITAD
jgi:hypothetical protein